MDALKLDIDNDFSLEEIESLDNIDITDLTIYERERLIDDKYERAVQSLIDTGDINAYFFKDFTVKIGPENIDINTTYYNRYTILDDRSLLMDLFSVNKSSINNKISRRSRFLIKAKYSISFLMILEHSEIVTIDSALNKKNVASPLKRQISASTLPIYKLDKKDNKFYSLDYIENDKELNYILAEAFESLKTFIAVNQYMMDLYNTNTKISVYNMDTKRFSNVTFKAYAATANNNKKVYSYIGNHGADTYSPYIEISIDCNRANILCGTDTPRKINDFKYFVRGHWSHRWKGHGSNKFLDRVWVNPFDKYKERK